jgi:hypothetical protein
VRLGLLLGVVVLVACGGSTPIAVSRNGKAVLEDASKHDGHLTRNWSCGSLRAAVSRLPEDPPTYSTLPERIDETAGKTCDAAFTSLRNGIVEEAVENALGAPTRTARCWRYAWPPDSSSSLDGARFCFTAGRISTIQAAVHG